MGILSHWARKKRNEGHRRPAPGGPIWKKQTIEAVGLRGSPDPVRLRRMDTITQGGKEWGSNFEVGARPLRSTRSAGKELRILRASAQDFNCLLATRQKRKEKVKER